MPSSKNSNIKKQVLYPKYAGFIVLYAIIFLTIGVGSAKILDLIFPDFDENNPKNRIVMYIEVLLQISAIALITYVFREYTNYIVNLVPVLSSSKYGSPDKFAALIIAPTMFSVQPHLIRKIRYLCQFEY